MDIRQVNIAAESFSLSTDSAAVNRRRTAQRRASIALRWIWIATFAFLQLSTPATAQDVFVPEGDPAVSLEGLLSSAKGIAVDQDGVVWVADTQNHALRRYLPDGTPLEVIGREAEPGLRDGSPAEARFNLPSRLALHPEGDILVVDDGSLIRRIDHDTLTTATLADVSMNVDASQVFDLLTDTTVNQGVINGLRIGDLGVRPNGDIFVSAADKVFGRDIFLLQIGTGLTRAVAKSYAFEADAVRGLRPMVVDRDDIMLATTLAGIGSPRQLGCSRSR